MTPQEQLEWIKKHFKNMNNFGWPEDVNWLISRVEQLEAAAKLILWINECRCDEAYTSRKMHAPNTLCGELDELIEALNTGPKPE